MITCASSNLLNSPIMAEGQAHSLLFSHQQKPSQTHLDWSLEGESSKQGYEIIDHGLYTKSKDRHFLSCKGKYTLFASLLMTSTISLLLFVGDRRNWVLSSSLYNTISNNRASAQIAVQVCANLFALFQITVLCTLINRATRLRFYRTRASLHDLQFWSHLCTPSMCWRLPLKYLLPLLLFIGLTIVPSALWTGALSPISISTTYASSIVIPSYQNASLIREYPSEVAAEIRNAKGVFSYAVGITMEGALLSTASSATTVDGSPRKHVKLDNSGFTYIGRSYGIGAPAGLTDSTTVKPTTTSYTYQEVGYNTEVRCIYNSSTAFFLVQDVDTLLWDGKGLLPNSNGRGEFSTYIGHGNGPSVVAIGVASLPTNGTQYMGIAAGSNYAFLNTTQCSIDYIPMLFNVTVSVKARDISVIAASSSKDIDPEGNLAHVATRQLALISNDQTNLYQSLLGNSFAGSIGNYNISQANSSISLTEATSTLTGLTNSVSAMLDDILIGYASAQLMVGNQSIVTDAIVTTMALKIGQRIYIDAMFTFNLVLIVIVFEELIRTKAWKGLQKWDYMDIGTLIVSSFEGGKDFSEMTSRDINEDEEISNKKTRSGQGASTSLLSIDNISRKYYLRLDRNNALVLDSPKRGYMLRN